MSQPAPAVFGFKSPPVDNVSGRGPPEREMRAFFPEFAAIPAIISYILHGKATTIKGKMKGLYAAEV